MPSAVFALALVAALGCGLVAGVLFAFSTFVMPALGRLPAPQSIAAMQSINTAAINPWFMTALFGTAASSLALIVVSLLNMDQPYSPYLLPAAALYLLGTIAVTMAFHVPRNDALSRVDPAGPGAATDWARYLTEWTRMNHLRTAAAISALVLLVGAANAG